MANRCGRLAVGAAMVVGAMVVIGLVTAMQGCIIVAVHDGESSSSWRSREKEKRIGVELAEVAPGTAAQAGVDASRASIVTRVVPGSPAEAAGVQAYDIITHVDGRDWARTGSLRDAVQSKREGETLKLTVVRNGKPVELSVTPRER